MISVRHENNFALLFRVTNRVRVTNRARKQAGLFENGTKARLLPRAVR